MHTYYLTAYLSLPFNIRADLSSARFAIPHKQVIITPMHAPNIAPNKNIQIIVHHPILQFAHKFP